MPPSSDPISAMLDALLTEIALDVALEAHSEIKRGRLLCTVCGTLCKASGSHCPPPSNLSISAAASQSLQANASPSSSRSTTPLPSSSVGSKKPLSALEKDFNQPTVDSSSGNIFFDCLNCSKPIASSRYAPHLSKCLGLGGRARTTGRAATRLKLGSEAGNSSDVESVTSKSKMKGLNGNAKRNATPTKASALSKRQKTSSASIIDPTPLLAISTAPPPPLPLPLPPLVPPPPPPLPPPPQHSYGGATPPRLQSKLSNGYDDDENGGYDYLAVDGDLVDTDSSGDEG